MSFMSKPTAHLCSSPLLAIDCCAPEVHCVEKQRALLLFDAFSQFVSRFRGEERPGGMSDKDIILLLYKKKLLSKRGLKLMVELSHSMQAKMAPSELFPLVVRHTRGEPYSLITYAIEKYLEVWSSCQGTPTQSPLIELERRPGMSPREHDPLCNPPFAYFNSASIPEPAVYGTFQDEDGICAHCGSFREVDLCSGCKNIRYCSESCQAADWTRHEPDCMYLHQIAATILSLNTPPSTPID